MSRIKLFYENYDDDEGVPSDNPTFVSKEEAIEYMEDLPPSDGNFIGFILPSGKTVQFVYNDDETLLLDLPVTDGIMAVGSHSKLLDSSDEALEIIEYIFEGNDPLKIEGLTYEAY